jgi:V/A-type H+/Na+-transporting ATPase subunit I
MIAKIKKYTFLVYHRDYKTLLDTLQNAGVVHIIEKGIRVEDSAPSAFPANLKRYDNAIRVLDKKLASLPVIQSDPGAEPDIKPESVIENIESLSGETEELKHTINQLRNEAYKVEPWGNYDPASFELLHKAGWHISLFTCPSKSFREEWKEQYSIEVINVRKGKTYFAVVHKSDEIPVIDADPEKTGEKPASELNAEIEKAEKKD